MTALQDVKDYLASVGVPAGRYSDAALLQVIAVESADQAKRCRVPAADLPDGLALHFRASDLDTLADAAAVSSWSSVVGNSVATQGSTPAQPTKRTVDGSDVVRFDGTDWLSLSGDALTLTQNLVGMTVLARVKLSSATGTQRVIGFSNNGLFTRAYFGGSSNFWRVDLRRLDGDAPAFLGTSAFDQALHNVAWTLDHGRATLSIHVDGVVKDNALATGLGTGPFANTPSQAVGLGADEEGSSPMFGDLYQLLVFNRVLADAERQVVETYLDGGATAWPLREALCRRVQVNLAKRALPLGVIEQSADAAGPSFVPRTDPEVRRLEAPYRKLVVG